MKLPVLLLISVAASVAPGAAPPPRRLLERARHAYTHPTSFAPAAMRHPLRRDPAAALARAREEAAARPDDPEARRQAALLADAADDPTAAEEWHALLDLLERLLKADRANPDLLERQVEALVGADAALRAVGAAERLLATRPESWRAHLLAGDAYLRRADFHWRVLARRSRAKAFTPGPELLQMNSDLKASEREYGRAVELAPDEPAPRGARIARALAAPLMASLLPQGMVQAPERPDIAAIRRDLMEPVTRAPGRVQPVWHAAHFLAADAHSVGSPEEVAAEVRTLGAALRRLLPGEDPLFAEEARGLLAFAVRDWEEARRAFEAALVIAPGRAFAAGWLGAAESQSPDPPARRIARLRARLAAAPRAQDWTLLGLLLAPEQPVAAEEALRQAIRLDVDDANARYNLALLLLRREPDSGEARHHLRRALEIRPDDREGRFLYGMTLALEGRPSAAAAALRALLRLADLDGGLKRRVEETLADLGAPRSENSRADGPGGERRVR
jgi:tetratricopeptide (TPR) repeat protein